jgi:hypothetical protein
MVSLTHILLNQNTIGGSVPSEIGLLLALESLDLSDNSFEGTIASELGTNLALSKSARYVLSTKSRPFMK